MKINRKLWELLIKINEYLAWFTFILFSITIHATLSKNGCINIEPYKTIIIYVGCAVIIGLSKFYERYIERNERKN